MKSKKIPYGKLCLAFVCLCVFVAAFMLGFFLWPFFLPAILAMAGYLYSDKRDLRCPYCGAWENLQRLYYAANHPSHCRGCGRLLEFDR